MAEVRRRRGTGLGSPRQPTREGEVFRQDVERMFDKHSKQLDASFVTVEDDTIDLPKARVLTAGANVTITDDGPGGAVTIAAAGGGGGAPTDATYVTLSLNGTLTDERVLTAGTGITVTDGGANGNVTVATTITQYTNEMAQDTVFGAVVDGDGIDSVYDDAANTFTISVNRVVYEVDFSSLADNGFANGVESIDGVNWTIGNTAAAGATWGVLNGSGIVWTAAASTAATFSSTTQTAAHLYVLLSAIIPNYDAQARYAFDFYVPSYLLEQSGDSIYFGLWGVAGTPTGSAVRVRAVGPRNQVGTYVPNTLAQTSTSQGTEDVAAAGYDVFTLIVEPDGVTQMGAGAWAAGWPAQTNTARMVTTALSAGDSLNRSDTRLVISFNQASDATPTTNMTLERMRIRRVG